MTAPEAKKSSVDISVILSTYKRPEILDITLGGFCTLKTEGLSWELIVVDNADDAGTREMVGRYAGQLPVKYMLENKKGKNNALNAAIGHARGEIFLFTDDDIIPDSRWMTEVWEGAKRWPEHMVFGGKVLPQYPKENVDIPLEPLFLQMSFVIADWDLAEGPYQAHKVWGPNMAVRRGIFRDGWRFNPNIGPCGSNYIMGSESEFNEKLEKVGYVPIYLPRSVVRHIIRKEQLTRGWLFRRAFRYGRFCAVKGLGVPNGPLLFRIPSGLLRDAFVAFAKLSVSFLINDRKRLYRFGLTGFQMAGMAFQLRKSLDIDPRPRE